MTASSARRSRRARRALLAAAFGAAAVSLQGCGSSSSSGATTTTTTTTTTTRAAGPVDCKQVPASVAAHCSSCWWTGGAEGKYACKDCEAPYSVDNTTQVCAVASCPAPEAIPGIPDKATGRNGVKWPDACFEVDSAHFFTIGDWGGVCSWDQKKGNICDGTGNPMQWDQHAKQYWPGDYQYDPFPMNNRQPGAALAVEDYIAQHLVRDRMAEQIKKLRATNEEPKFMINVGDNFYPGGIDKHCGTGAPEASFESSQFAQVFEAMYPRENLTNMEWWSVLGNHDYGGTCAVKGWDQQIYYTWKPNGRWVMPGQYWQRKVQFKTFSVDFYFLDSNVYDTKAQNPGMLEKHDICSLDNTGREPIPAPGGGDKKTMGYCPMKLFPPPPGSNEDGCPKTGPWSQSTCDTWFKQTWEAQYTWFLDAISKSTADWQIVVTHYPATYNPGTHQAALIWPDVAAKYGIDLIISGHTHEQKVVYKNSEGGVDLGDTAWVITGGGGGVTAEGGPHPDGEDDTYGFMDMKISLENIEITAFSHGGRQGKEVIRSKTTVVPRQRSTPSEKEAAELVV